MVVEGFGIPAAKWAQSTTEHLAVTLSYMDFQGCQSGLGHWTHTVPTFTNCNIKMFKVTYLQTKLGTFLWLAIWTTNAVCITNWLGHNGHIKVISLSEVLVRIRFLWLSKWVTILDCSVHIKLQKSGQQNPSTFWRTKIFFSPLCTSASSTTVRSLSSKWNLLNISSSLISGSTSTISAVTHPSKPNILWQMSGSRGPSTTLRGRSTKTGLLEHEGGEREGFVQSSTYARNVRSSQGSSFSSINWLSSSLEPSWYSLIFTDIMLS